MIRLAETRGKLIAVCRGTEPNANGPDNPICEPPRSCTDARTIVPTASPTTVDSCCGGMGCLRMSTTSIRIVSFRCWRLFWTIDANYAIVDVFTHKEFSGKEGNKPWTRPPP